jgi:hypothetical protein
MAEVEVRNRELSLKQTFLMGMVGAGSMRGWWLVLRTMGPDGEQVQPIVDVTSEDLDNNNRWDRAMNEPILEQLSKDLIAKGWQPLPRGLHWYSYRFRRPLLAAHGPARTTPSAEQHRSFGPFNETDWRAIRTALVHGSAMILDNGEEADRLDPRPFADSLKSAAVRNTSIGGIWIGDFLADPRATFREAVAARVDPVDGLIEFTQLLDRLPLSEAHAMRVALIDAMSALANSGTTSRASREAMVWTAAKASELILAVE